MAKGGFSLYGRSETLRPDSATCVPIEDQIFSVTSTRRGSSPAFHDLKGIPREPAARVPGEQGAASWMSVWKRAIELEHNQGLFISGQSGTMHG
jgi:hypothetical protein